MTTDTARAARMMADRTANITILMNLRNACQQGDGVRSIEFGKVSGDQFIAALTDAISAMAELTTLTARVEAAEGLVAKWDELSAQHGRSQELCRDPVNSEWHGGMSEAINDCAQELRAAMTPPQAGERSSDPAPPQS